LGRKRKLKNPRNLKGKVIVEKATGKVVDRYVGRRSSGITQPSNPVLIGSWTQEYNTKYYRVEEV